MKFSPTPAQILAAQQFFIAQKFQLMVKAQFEQWEQEILESGTYHISPLCYEPAYENSAGDLPRDRIIRDRKDLIFIDGFALDNIPARTDADRFFLELRNKAIQHGFKYGEEALSKANYEQYRLRNAFLNATVNIHNKQWHFMPITSFDQLLKDLIERFAPLVDNDSLQPLEQEFYQQRMIDKEAESPLFHNDEQSFKRFQALKKTIPVREFMASRVEDPDPDDEPLYEGIEYVLSYMPDCYIFQMKPGCTWSPENFKSTTYRYAFVNYHEQLIESNVLDYVERHLFDHFLSYVQ